MWLETGTQASEQVDAPKAFKGLFRMSIRNVTCASLYDYQAMYQAVIDGCRADDPPKRTSVTVLTYA